MYHQGASYPGIPNSWTNITSTKQTAGILRINNNLEMNKIKEFDNSIFAGISTRTESIKLGAQYTRPTEDLEADISEWEPIVDSTSNFLLGGDFNAHHPGWGGDRIDPNGEIILEICAALSLTIVNDNNQPPSFFLPDRSGNTDITIAYQNISEQISDWTSVNGTFPPFHGGFHLLGLRS